MKPEGTQNWTVAIPEATLRRFKALCAERGYVKEKLAPAILDDFMSRPPGVQDRIYHGSPAAAEDPQFQRDIEAVLRKLELLPPREGGEATGKKRR